jgi:small GTP-binding protein
MPTNVTPEYRKAEEAYREAKSLDEKIERLQDMISLLPKHKGTDHLYADLKRRLAKLRREFESSGGRRGGGLALDFTREGAAQIVLIGPPNSGKSSILRTVTNAHPEVAEYPFTTQKPIPGMIPYEDIQIQLVDTPAVTDDYLHMHLLGLVRSADGVLIVADLSSDSLLEDLEMVIETFRERRIEFVRRRNPDEHNEVLCRIIANKKDAEDALPRLALLKEMIGGRLDILPLSCHDVRNTAALPETLFKWLELVRVYSKIPGEKADLDHPFTVFRGGTVEDICFLVHKDFVQNLKFARLWRRSDAPITVSRHEPVEDGDILELHL